MEERASAHEELGGMRYESLPDPGSFFGGGTKLLSDWGCPPGRGAAMFQEIVQYFRKNGWREPPVQDQAPGRKPEWLHRAGYRLPPERVQANAQRVREQLHAKQHTDESGATDPVGGDSGTEGPEVSDTSEA